MQRIEVLALDVEGTLISNAMSQIPRMGLMRFLESCSDLVPRIVIFTAVSAERFQEIAETLVADALAPSWFLRLEYIHWHGEHKGLSFIEGVDVDNVVLVDDFEEYVEPSQRAQWIRIKCFESPYEDDDELARVEQELRRRIATIKQSEELGEDGNV